MPVALENLGEMPLDAIQGSAPGGQWSYTVKAQNGAVIEVQWANKVFFSKKCAGGIPFVGQRVNNWRR